MFYAWIVDLEGCVTSLLNGLIVAGKLHQNKLPERVQFGGTMVTVAGSTYQNFFKEVYIPAMKYAGVIDW